MAYHPLKAAAALVLFFVAIVALIRPPASTIRLCVPKETIAQFAPDDDLRFVGYGFGDNAWGDGLKVVRSWDGSACFDVPIAKDFELTINGNVVTTDGRWADLTR